MQLRQIDKIMGIVLLICCGIVGVSQARTITAYSLPPMLPFAVATLDPNNDNANPSTNIVDLFIPSSLVTAPIDIVFKVELSKGTTEYLLTETLTNNTNSSWRSFRFELGLGTFLIPSDSITLIFFGGSCHGK